MRKPPDPKSVGPASLWEATGPGVEVETLGGTEIAKAHVQFNPVLLAAYRLQRRFGFGFARARLVAELSGLGGSP